MKLHRSITISLPHECLGYVTYVQERLFLQRAPTKTSANGAFLFRIADHQL